MDFPLLYGKPSNSDKIKTWKVIVSEKDNIGIITRKHGYENFKIQESEKQILKGKNIGRKNETTPLQQATKPKVCGRNKKMVDMLKRNQIF